MSTSGSTDFAMTTREIVEDAFRLVGALGKGMTLASEDAETGRRALNLMVKTWGTKGRLWLKAEGSVTLTASQASYTLPGTVQRILSIRRRTSSIDTPLNELSREEYFDLPTKSATGMPVSWYFDPQRSTNTLYIWPTASAAVAAGTTLPYTYLRTVQDLDALADDPDFPQEWLEALIYGLADRLTLRYGTNRERAADIKAEAIRLYAGLSAHDEETASVFLMPVFR